jgi:hypothetical protein
MWFFKAFCGIYEKTSDNTIPLSKLLAIHLHKIACNHAEWMPWFDERTWVDIWDQVLLELV